MQHDSIGQIMVHLLFVILFKSESLVSHPEIIIIIPVHRLGNTGLKHKCTRSLSFSHANMYLTATREHSVAGSSLNPL